MRGYGSDSDEDDFTPITTTINGKVVSTAFGAPASSRERGEIPSNEIRNASTGKHSSRQVRDVLAAEPRKPAVARDVVPVEARKAGSSREAPPPETRKKVPSLEAPFTKTRARRPEERNEKPSSVVFRGLPQIEVEPSAGLSDLPPIQRNATLGRTKRESNAFATTSGVSSRRASMPDAFGSMRPLATQTLAPHPASTNVSEEYLSASIISMKSVQLSQEIGEIKQSRSNEGTIAGSSMSLKKSPIGNTKMEHSTIRESPSWRGDSMNEDTRTDKGVSPAQTPQLLSQRGTAASTLPRSAHRAPTSEPTRAGYNSEDSNDEFNASNQKQRRAQHDPPGEAYENERVVRQTRLDDHDDIPNDFETSRATRYDGRHGVIDGRSRQPFKQRPEQEELGDVPEMQSDLRKQRNYTNSTQQFHHNQRSTNPRDQIELEQYVEQRNLQSQPHHHFTEGDVSAGENDEESEDITFGGRGSSAMLSKKYASRENRATLDMRAEISRRGTVSSEVQYPDQNETNHVGDPSETTGCSDYVRYFDGPESRRGSNFEHEVGRQRSSSISNEGLFTRYFDHQQADYTNSSQGAINERGFDSISERETGPSSKFQRIPSNPRSAHGGEDTIYATLPRRRSSIDQSYMVRPERISRESSNGRVSRADTDMSAGEVDGGRSSVGWKEDHSDTPVSDYGMQQSRAAAYSTESSRLAAEFTPRSQSRPRKTSPGGTNIGNEIHREGHRVKGNVYK
ncbi:hypothetical protein BJ742DRAFT_847052 [Cladochytrium replicatum]|nr:hypothetical protein BJ742DRAFT_847052 [Cladochytrium replicatum]